MKDYGIEYNGGDLCRFFNGIKSLVIFSLRSVSTNAPMKHYCKELNIFSFFREGFYFLSLSFLILFLTNAALIVSQQQKLSE